MENKQANSPFSMRMPTPLKVWIEKRARESFMSNSAFVTQILVKEMKEDKKEISQ
ncbi:hypothetical protein [Grimontia sp. SpTr1]|uniref:hypothetical protein n=1 Tax=Grimontia sp. SpTr1 TaxID=2995319 RepID=UPI00248B9880|nr:hypothetical protein [Grimontia sp. SpTr1]